MHFAIQSHLRSLNSPPISEVKEWLAERRDDGQTVIDLCQAVPGYPPAREMTHHLSKLVLDPLTSKYTPDEGLPEVRQAICHRYQRRYAAKIAPQHLCLTIGASQAYWLAIMALCHSGDEVILQAPCYFDHALALEAFKIRPVFAPFDQKGRGIPDPAVINRLVTPRTRAIVLVNPGNPTGVQIPSARLTEMYLLARKHRIALILDETYSDFIQEQPHELFTIPDWHNTLIQIMSFGKSYALTGYRAGLLAAAPEVIVNALKIQDSMVVCQPRITQLAVKFGVENLDDWVEGNRLMMNFRHNLFCNAFNIPGNRFRIVASGNFFAWVRHPFSSLSGRKVVKKLVDEAAILCLPGEVFGPGLEGYLRLAFGNISEDMIPRAVARFCEMSR